MDGARNVIPSPLIADVSPFVSAGTGVAGALVALTGEMLRRRWQRPRLRILPFRATKGDGVFVDDPPSRQSAWIRLGVLNDGRETARDVEIHIEDIVATDARPDPQRLETFQKQDLALLMGRRLKWADRDDQMIDIPPGMVRRIDIAHLSTEQPTYSVAGALAVPMRFKLDRQSVNTLREVVAGLEYRLELSVSGSNCRTTLFRVRLAFGGTWIGPDSVDPLVDGSLRVEEVAQQSLSRWAKAGALNRVMRRG